jgi:hypothetical protein
MRGRYFWPLFLLLTLGLRRVAQGHPDWVERCYTQGLYQVVRFVFDYLLGWLPFPCTYLVFAGVGVATFRAVHIFLKKGDQPLLARFSRMGGGFLKFLCGLVAFFYWLWGFNYDRPTIETQLGLTPYRLSAAEIKMALDSQTAVVLRLRLSLQADSSRAIEQGFAAEQLEAAVRDDVAAGLQALGLAAPGRPRGRQPFWPGFLLRFGAAGIYHPFSGECNIDPGLHFLTQADGLAHEFCHGYGFGDEGTCNFLAYLALRRSRHPALRYSAELGYWRSLAAACRRADPDYYAARRAQLPTGFLRDLDNIYAALERYPEFFESFRYAAYDQYLKAQGVAEGMQSYGRVIDLVASYERSEARR